MISLHHAETDNTNTPLTDNESANAETFPYNETEKVTAVLKGGGGGRGGSGGGGARGGGGGREERAKKNSVFKNKTNIRPQIIY